MQISETSTEHPPGKQHLLLIALGPVQDFIMTARSSGDLWLGSTLLSECSKAAARAITLETGSLGSLIFPAPASAAELEPIGASPTEAAVLNVANVILARVGEPARAAEAARAAVRECLNSHWERAKKSLPAELNATALAQLEDLIEWYWASSPLTGDYVASRNRVYAILNARKANRDFGPATWGAALPKSSLDGARESVIPEAQYPGPGANPAERARKAKTLFQRYGVRIGERLCAIGLLKRRAMRGRERPSFRSTSHMAVLPLLQREVDGYLEAAKAKLDELRALVDETQADFLEEIGGEPHPLIGNLDGRVLLPERMREAFENKENLETAQRLVAEMLRLAYNAPNAARQKRWEAPVYYALLHADGDRMGKAIDKLTTPEEHRKLSSVLAGFAETAKAIIRRHQGCPVFVGGDDILGYLPVHTALECCAELAANFKTTLEQFKFTEDGKEIGPTLSAGLVIAHYLDPLQDTLQAAKVAEKTAKINRESLAVTLIKRSGAPISVAGHWGTVDVRLANFRDLHRRDLMPDGAGYELRELARNLERVGLVDAAKAEAKRILSRKRPKQGKALLATAEIDNMVKHIQTTSLEAIANELIVARILADACEIANVYLEAEKDAEGNGAGNQEVPA